MKTKFIKKKPIFIAAAVIIVAIIALVYGLNTGKLGNNASSAGSDKIPALEQLNDAGKWAEAEKMANEILSANPSKATKVDALWELALAESSQSKFDKAIEDAKALQVLDSASGHYVLGLVYIDSKQSDLAKQELTKAAQQDSSYKEDVNKILEGLQ